MKELRFRTVAPGAVKLADPVLAGYEERNYAATIPSSLAKCYETGRIEALKLQWQEGEPNKPHYFWDSDVAKVLEGMAYELELHPGDAKLAAELEKVVDLFVAAQQKDGYLNSCITSLKEERFVNTFDKHELYCAGHLMEAAVAHFHATGSRKFLDCLCRYADYIISRFGKEEGKLHGYPGHEEIELGLCKLADATGDNRYLQLAEYFINERGTEPNFFLEEAKLHKTAANSFNLENRQAHLPVREQKTAVGHSVRALYLYAGMIDVAARTGDDSLLEAVKTIFEELTTKRMYVTGGVGSDRRGEAFTVDYELANAPAYSESCASMALVQVARRLFQATGDGHYLDVMEQVLYNAAVSGISLSGDKFFYANPLEIEANFFASGHILPTRQPWFGCSCCPTSYCRFLPQVAGFVWAVGSRGEVSLNVPAAGRFDDGTRALNVTGRYPYDGAFAVTNEKAGRFALAIRIPGWCRSWSAELNGKTLPAVTEKGFLVIDREWQPGDRVGVVLDMPVDVVHANSLVTMDAGRIALARGPLVYAFESVDNGDVLPRLVIPAEQEFKLAPAPGLPEGTVAITGRCCEEEAVTELYSRTAKPARRERSFTAIPYALWQNRGASHMEVWMRGEEGKTF